MTRSLTTAVKNELATNDIRPIHLITIGFSSPVNITDCSFPLTSSVSGSSVTYASSSFVMGISNFSEEVDITKTTLNLGLSGADQTFISTALNENVVNDSVTIHRGFLDDSKKNFIQFFVSSTIFQRKMYFCILFETSGSRKKSEWKVPL